jgi:hypothetical protein
MFRKKQFNEKDRNSKYPSLQSDILLNYSINLEPIFDGSKEGEMAANIDKYFESYKLTMPHSLYNLIDRYNGSEYPVKFLINDSVLPWALDVARNKGIEGGPFFTQSCAVTAVLYHAAQEAFQVPVEESDQAAVSLHSLENLEFNDLPSFLLFIHCMLNTARQFAI